MDINRRDFFKLVGATAAVAAASNFGITEAAKNKPIKLTRQAPVVGSKLVESRADGSTAKVYFTKKIDADYLIKLSYWRT